MKKIFYAIVIIGCVSSGCKKVLNLNPLDAITSSSFLTNETEIFQGLAGVYNGAQWNYASSNVPLIRRTESATDFGLSRKGTDADDLIALGDNGPFINGNAIPASAWTNAYILVARSNSFLEGMTAGQAATPAASYNKMRAEALVLRAWAYYHLMAWFGDVPYFTKSLKPSEYETQLRIAKQVIAADLYKDLDEAWSALPDKTDRGRVNKGVAYGLKAKIAMLIKDYKTAAASTKAIIDGKYYSLNPAFTNLFTLAGQTANTNGEIMFMTQYPADAVAVSPFSYTEIGLTPRQVLGTSGNNYPTQALIDKFECSDGKRIDKSPLYDPANPGRNRDKRLGWTIFMPGDEMNVATGAAISLPYQNPAQKILYNIYTDVVIRWNWTTNAYVNVAGNPDYVASSNSVWQYGSTGSVGGVGYCWKKYIDPAQNAWAGKSGYILMRYAEILLTYAEAKIELNEIDGTVTAAIDLVRDRAGQPVTAVSGQDALRQLVRRERGVELAMEGIRFVDLLRWGIYNQAVNGPIVGAAKNPAIVPELPTFTGTNDLNDIPDYTTSLSKRIDTRSQVRKTTAKHTLWPIPQGELDKNRNITQNPEW